METKYKENDIIENLKFLVEYLDNEIIYNYIDCPICKSGFKDVDCNRDLSTVNIISCKECGSEFKLVKGAWYDNNSAKIIRIGMGKIMSIEIGIN